MNTTLCSLDDCRRPHHAKGYCAMHHARLRRTGDPRAVLRTSTLDSFWKRVEKGAGNGCWVWRGYVCDSCASVRSMYSVAGRS